MTKRKLIPDDQIIVILDTNVARALALSPSPGWLATFQAMSSDGYSFSLADTTVAELILQVRAGQISTEQHKHMIECLETFLNSDFRALPSRIDLQAMIGASDEPPMEDTIYLSQHMWKQLVDPSTYLPVMGPQLEDIRTEERSDWPKWISRVASHAEKYGMDLVSMSPTEAAKILASHAKDSLDAHSRVTPPMSVRRHLDVLFRFRQSARSVQRKEPYDPKSLKKINDGVDVDLFQYLILPAFVLSEDSFFSSKLEDITSFQKAWLFRPEALAAQWENGLRPQPTWPLSSNDE